jgi:hypothetical protein
MPTEFVSVVGVNRSGTTLMRNVLNRSDQLAIADENHFLGHLVASQGARYAFRGLGPLSDDETVRRLVDFIYSGELRRASRFKNYIHWGWLTRNVDRGVLVQQILRSDRSERALFVAFLKVYAEAQGKPILGEKTPAHFRYVATLLEWFPNGKIIHMVRDPRGTFISDLKRRKEERPGKQARVFDVLRRSDLLLKLFILLVTSRAWAESVSIACSFRSRFPDRYRLQRFEDLVVDPEGEVKEICRFLEIEYQQAMLEQLVVRGFQKGDVGFDGKAAARWKEHIDSWVDAWFRLRFGRRLLELGYL